MLATVFS